MIERDIEENEKKKWVAGDKDYGVGDIEQQLRQAGKGYVLESAALMYSIPGASVDRLLARTPTSRDAAFDRLETPVRRGRNQRTAAARSVLSRIGRSGSRRIKRRKSGSVDARSTDPTSQRRRRSRLLHDMVSSGNINETLVAVEGHRWAIEDSFETAKNEFGLDHNESRYWHGWHRHVSMVMLAFAMMAAIRHHANPPPKKSKRRSAAKTNASPRRH